MHGKNSFFKNKKKMLRNKIVHFKMIYKFALNYFFIGVIALLLFIKNVFLEIQNLIFLPKYMRYEKHIRDKIVHLKKIHKFISEHFFIGHIVFVLIVKNVIKNKKFHFSPNLCEIRKKCWETKLLILRRYTNVLWTIFS